MKIVTGMHRSGTSMIMGMLYKMGADLGDENLLLAADRWNKRGYFENREIFILNDSILLGGYAPSRKYWESRPEDRSLLLRIVMGLARLRYILVMQNPAALEQRTQRHADRVRQAEKDFGSIYIKDPRMSLLVGAWANIVPVEKVLYVFRHPAEVALSLKQRGNSGMGFNYAMWKLHVEQFLQNADGLRVAMVNYNNFFVAERQLDEVKRLYNFLEQDYDTESAQAFLEQALDVRLKTQTHTDEKLPDDIQALYTELLKLHQEYDSLQPFQR